MSRVGCPHIPERYSDAFREHWDLTPGPFAEVVLTLVDRLVSGEVLGGILSGPVGVGKTMAAAIACNELAAPAWAKVEHWDDIAKAQGRDLSYRDDQTQRILTSYCPAWIAVPGLLAQLRREMGTGKRGGIETLEDALRTQSLLVLDDVGVRTTDWSVSTITELVCDRYDRGHRTLITSNLTPQELADTGLDRVVSRLAEGGVLMNVSAGAPDYRFRARVELA